MFNLVIFISLFLSSTSLFGQNCDSTQWAQPGTYTVVIDSAAFESADFVSGVIMLSENDLCYIESQRRPFETVEIHIGIYLVTIFPKPHPTNSLMEE